MKNYSLYNEPAIEALNDMKAWFGEEQYESIVRDAAIMSADINVKMVPLELFAKRIGNMLMLDVINDDGDWFAAMCFYRFIFPTRDPNGAHNPHEPSFDAATFNPFRSLDS